MNTREHEVLSDGRQRQESAFTLIEMLVTVALLSVIIIGLVAMFSQVRRAFMSSLAQVDVLESGRAATALIAQDLEQMAPCYTSNGINFYVATSLTYGSSWTASGLALPTEQMADPNDHWTNLIQELFFLTPAPPSNAVWTGIGYRLQGADEANGIGSLYRYHVTGLTSTNQTSTNNVNGQIQNGTQVGFTATTLTTNCNRIIDGVTHFSVLAYQTNGLLYPLQKNNGLILVQQGNVYPAWEYRYAFYSNVVPAYVEIELGILETAALEHYRAFGPGTAAANNYLMNHPGAVHLFRQRIPIRSYDPSAIQ